MPVITISRTAGSEGGAVGKELCRRLKYRYFDREELAKIARQHRYLRADLEVMDEKSLAFFDRFFRDKPKEYLSFLHAAIWDAAEEDNVVVLGRGGQAVLRDLPTAFHVRVDAPLEVRVQRTMERFGESENKARKRVREKDQERERFVQQAFGLAPSNPLLYHLLINTGKMDVPTSTKVVLHSFRQIGWQKRQGESKGIIQQIRLAKAIRGELVHNPHITCPGCVDVRCDEGGVVTLRGRLTEPSEKPLIENVVRAVRGVSRVVSELRP
jgi:cytidylate kinase